MSPSYSYFCFMGLYIYIAIYVEESYEGVFAKIYFSYIAIRNLSLSMSVNFKNSILCIICKQQIEILLF